MNYSISVTRRNTRKRRILQNEDANATCKKCDKMIQHELDKMPASFYKAKLRHELNLFSRLLTSTCDHCPQRSPARGNLQYVPYDIASLLSVNQLNNVSIAHFSVIDVGCLFMCCDEFTRHKRANEL